MMLPCAPMRRCYCHAAAKRGYLLRHCRLPLAEADVIMLLAASCRCCCCHDASAMIRAAAMLFSVATARALSFSLAYDTLPR